MHIGRFIACLALPLAIASCGGDPPPAETGPRTCAGHSPAEDCMNPDNFEQCRTFEAQCPGQVVVQETCPLQFSCPN